MLKKQTGHEHTVAQTDNGWNVLTGNMENWNAVKKEMIEAGKGENISSVVHEIQRATGIGGVNQPKTQAGANAVAALRSLTLLSALERMVFTSGNDAVQAAITAGYLTVQDEINPAFVAFSTNVPSLILAIVYSPLSLVSAR